MPDLLQRQMSVKVIGQWIFESPLWSLINQYNSNLFPLLWTSSLPASTNSSEHPSGCRLHDLAHFELSSFWIRSSLAAAGTESVLLLPYHTSPGFFRESYLFNFSLEAKGLNKSLLPCKDSTATYPQGKHNHSSSCFLPLLASHASLQSSLFAAHQFPSALLFFS